MGLPLHRTTAGRCTKGSGDQTSAMGPADVRTQTATSMMGCGSMGDGRVLASWRTPTWLSESLLWSLARLERLSSCSVPDLGAPRHHALLQQWTNLEPVAGMVLWFSSI